MLNEGDHFCGLRASFVTELLTPARPRLCRWFLANETLNLPTPEVRAALKAAAGAWPKVANVRVEEVLVEEQADLVIRCVDLGGPYGVLADCELPGPKVQHMRLDSTESWVVHLGQDVPANLIDLYRVAVHEWGHAWGMGHAPQGSPNLMSPTYSRSIWVPQGWERDQMVRGYGPPPPAPEPPVVPSEPPEAMVKWIAALDAAGATLAKYEVLRRVA